MLDDDAKLIQMVRVLSLSQTMYVLFDKLDFHYIESVAFESEAGGYLPVFICDW